MNRWFSDKFTELSGTPVDFNICQKLRENAEKYFASSYPFFDPSSGDSLAVLKSESAATRQWLCTALRSSTGHDRIFAMAYLVNLYPMNCLRYLDTLIGMVNPAKQRDCLRSTDVLHQLFGSSLLPKHRNLIPFNSRPTDLNAVSANPADHKRILCLWFFEDQLKIKFASFVKALERLLMADTTENFKRRALRTLHDYVLKFPENRSLILGIMINKLGDRSKVLASSVIHHLRTIASARKTLIKLLIQEMHAFLFRPNLLDRAKYYALVFLSCLELRSSHDKEKHHGVSETALLLVKLYSAFFHSAVKADEIPERLVKVLLTGLSRAAPFVKDNQFEDLLQEIDDIFRLVHTSNFNLSLQALSVLFQLTSHKPAFRDRYYQTLYRKLRDPALLNTSRGSTVLYLVYRSLVNDSDPERAAAFAHRLLQICLIHPSPAFVVGTLILLSKVQSMKGGYILTNQTLAASENISNAAAWNDGQTDDEEAFSDAPDSDTEIDHLQNNTQRASQPNAVLGSWYHRRLTPVMANRSGKTTTTSYRPNAREPLFARAGGHPSWPLVALTKHSHPTVALFADMILQGKSISYTGNPFDDFTLLHFLDRFAFKKPKVNKNSRKRAPPGQRLQRHGSNNTGSRAFAVNSAMFRQLSIDKVPADEQFFHSYAKFLADRTGGQVATQKSPDSDDSVSDNEFDAYLEKYEKGLIPSGDGIDEADDVDFDGAEFSNDSGDEGHSSVDEADEAMFEAMDGVSGAAKTSFLDDSFMDVDVDNLSDDGSDEIESESFGTKKRKQKSRNLEGLFASAEEVSHLYNQRETPKQRKQRLWEEKRSLDPSQMRFNRKRSKMGKSRNHGDRNKPRRAVKQTRRI